MISMQEVKDARAAEMAMSGDEFAALLSSAPDGITPAQRLEMGLAAEAGQQMTVPGGVTLSLEVALRSFFDFQEVQIPWAD